MESPNWECPNSSNQWHGAGSIVSKHTLTLDISLVLCSQLPPKSLKHRDIPHSSPQRYPIHIPSHYHCHSMCISEEMGRLNSLVVCLVRYKNASGDQHFISTDGWITPVIQKKCVVRPKWGTTHIVSWAFLNQIVCLSSSTWTRAVVLQDSLSFQISRGCVCVNSKCAHSTCFNVFTRNFRVNWCRLTNIWIWMTCFVQCKLSDWCRVVSGRTRVPPRCFVALLTLSSRGRLEGTNRNAFSQ